MHTPGINMHTIFFTQYRHQNRGVEYGSGNNLIKSDILQIGAGLDELNTPHPCDTPNMESNTPNSVRGQNKNIKLTLKTHQNSN